MSTDRTYRDVQAAAVAPTWNSRKAVADDAPFLVYAEIDRLLLQLWERDHGPHYVANRTDRGPEYLRAWGVTFRSLMGEDAPTNNRLPAPSLVPFDRVLAFRSALRTKLGLRADGRES